MCYYFHQESFNSMMVNTKKISIQFFFKFTELPSLNLCIIYAQRNGYYHSLIDSNIMLLPSQ